MERGTGSGSSEEKIMSRFDHSTLCPVCGYLLGFESWKGNSASHEMCPSCGIEFGYDDVPEASGTQGTRDQIYTRWRKRWVKDGMKWSSHGIAPPPGWNPLGQLKMIGVKVEG
jgi:hypothetical protein